MNPKPTKKSSFSDREYADQEPSECDIATKESARYLPIEVVERDLDRWAWGTQNFIWREFRDKRGEFWIGASLELVLPWTENGQTRERRLVGACNFAIGTYAPNSHFVATAKSECVKNAASDLGCRFGRGLNDDIAPPSRENIPAEKPKRKPDKDIMEQFKKAKERGDKTAMDIMSNIYEFNTEENGNETL